MLAFAEEATSRPPAAPPRRSSPTPSRTFGTSVPLRLAAWCSSPGACSTTRGHAGLCRCPRRAAMPLCPHRRVRWAATLCRCPRRAATPCLRRCFRRAAAPRRCRRQASRRHRKQKAKPQAPRGSPTRTEARASNPRALSENNKTYIKRRITCCLCPRSVFAPAVRQATDGPRALGVLTPMKSPVLLQSAAYTAIAIH